MKVAVVGNGHVGMAVFRELLDAPYLNELTLVGRRVDAVRSEVEDYLDATAVSKRHTPKLGYGGYAAVEGADIIVYAAGSSKMANDRLEMLQTNCDIAESIFREINKYNRDAIVLALTNPLDVIVTKIRQVTGRDRHKVIGTGTLLESARLTRCIADLLEVSPNSVSAWVIGEHGNSSVALVDNSRIMGLTLSEYLSAEVGVSLDMNPEAVNALIRERAFRIIAGKGFTSTGVAASAERVVSAIAGDTREILPVSMVLDGEYGVRGFAISVPVLVGREGAIAVKQLPLSDADRASFDASAETLRAACRDAGLV